MNKKIKIYALVGALMMTSFSGPEAYAFDWSFLSRVPFIGSLFPKGQPSTTIPGDRGQSLLGEQRDKSTGQQEKQLIAPVKKKTNWLAIGEMAVGALGVVAGIGAAGVCLATGQPWWSPIIGGGIAVASGGIFLDGLRRFLMPPKKKVDISLNDSDIDSSNKEKESLNSL